MFYLLGPTKILKQSQNRCVNDSKHRCTVWCLVPESIHESLYNSVESVIQLSINIDTQKKLSNFFCAIQSVLHRWVGLYKPPVVTHCPLFALDTFYTLLCVYNPTKDSVIYVCLHAQGLKSILHSSPASCLTHVMFSCSWRTISVIIFFNETITN